RVLAVDAQVGRAASRVDCGLLQVLEEPSRFASAVAVTEIEGLAMLPGGVGTANKAATLDASLEPVLEAACCQFDLVLVDGGLGSNPVTTRLAAECDGALMLVRLGETTVDSARRLAKSLRIASVNVLGSVVLGSD
ncbi:MAG: hypothetical protein MI757_19960, partial [Pirellulales bacterium]|nr:hypothetical protein [Pirellulales bacterium]